MVRASTYIFIPAPWAECEMHILHTNVHWLILRFLETIGSLVW